MANDPPKTIVGKYKYEIPEEYELLVGKVIVAWSRVEGATEEAIWSILNIDAEQGRIITSPLDAKYKISMLRGLAIKELRGDKLKEFHKVVKLLRNLYEHRSVIAHGNWITVPTGQYAALSLKRKTPENQDQFIVEVLSYTDEHLKTLAYQCIMSMNYLIDLRNQFAS